MELSQAMYRKILENPENANEYYLKSIMSILLNVIIFIVILFFINVFVEMVFNLLFNILSSILNHNHLFNIKNKNREYPIKSHSSHPSKK